MSSTNPALQAQAGVAPLLEVVLHAVQLEAEVVQAKHAVLQAILN